MKTCGTCAHWKPHTCTWRPTEPRPFWMEAKFCNGLQPWISDGQDASKCAVYVEKTDENGEKDR